MSDFASVSYPAVLADLREIIAQDLRPIVPEIDLRGVYPETFMRRMGAAGGFAQSVPVDYGGAGRSIQQTVALMEEVSRECLSTGFCVWCQTVCGYYIQHGSSEFLKAEFLPKIADGRMLAGTGMSNPMKHFADIEKIRLTATRGDGGYRVSGALPWVSNAVPDGCFAFVAQIAGSEGEYLMAVTPPAAPGLTLGDGGHFIALEGSSTHNAVFKDVFVPDDYILAAPCRDFITAIRPGFVLTQTGFGLGLIASCVDLMRRSNERIGHVNQYLDDGPDEIEADWRKAQCRTYTLAEQIGLGDRPLGPDATREAVACRVLVSELSLRASQAAMLHAGAGGYRTGAAAERKLRESYFVAIVTPALKHLKKLQHDMGVRN